MTQKSQKSRYCIFKDTVAGLKFFKNTQKTAFCLLLFSIFSAQASFVSRCSISATVLEDTSGIPTSINNEHEMKSISVKVKIEKVSAPTDTACQDIKIGTSMDIFIERVNWSTLKKGQKITFNRLYKTQSGRAEPFIFYHVF